MNTDRIKEIQEETPYPKSVSVQQALLKVWNETEQEQLRKTDVNPSYFPEGTWVKAKRSGGKRYVTKQTNSECFEDDGKVSRQAPSPYCHYDNYEAM